MSIYSARVSIFVSILFLTATALGGEADSKGEWTQWRGPNRDGHTATNQWPQELSKLDSKWNVSLDPSYSGPLVTSDHVYVTETVGKKFEVVKAINRTTGKVAWEARWEGAMSVPFFAASNGSWIRATPCIDEDRIYVAGIRDVLVCIDTNKGEIIWKYDFVKEMKTSLPNFGFVSSPLVIKDHVYVQAGGGFVKLDKRTGKLVWRTLSDGGGMSGSAFSSPIFASLHGVDQFIVQTRSKLVGVDIQNGDVLWSEKIQAFRGMNILTPTVIGNSIFTSSYGGKSTLYDIAKSGDEWSVEPRWTHKSQAYMSSPIVYEGHIYLHLRNQRFLCLDAKTGDEKWTSKPFGKYWSMVCNTAGQILALDQRGDLLLIEASPEEFKLVDRRKVAEDSWAHLAVVDGQVFVRALNSISRMDW